MTREEREAAISYLETYRKMDEDLFKLSPQNSIAHHATAQCLKYWDMAIEALKKDPILDKIKDEIEQFADTHCSGDDINIYDVFQIIDKYKESEGEDGM